jgi:RNA polymerase sigma-70 factor (ECF subfamily)
MLIVREIPFIEAVLRQHGVRRCDLQDVVQDVLFGAWKSIQQGRFRPFPNVPLRESIRAWLYGVAWRQASHYRDAAHRRHEIPSGQPKAVVNATHQIENQVNARKLLEAIRRLPRDYQEVLALVGLGAEISEVARQLGLREATANTRIQRGRWLFRRTLRRWRKASRFRRRG